MNVFRKLNNRRFGTASTATVSTSDESITSKGGGKGQKSIGEQLSETQHTSSLSFTDSDDWEGLATPFLYDKNGTGHNGRVEKQEPYYPASSSCVASAKAAEQQNIPKSVLYKIPLIPVLFNFGVVSERKKAKLPFQLAVQRERLVSKADVTIVFAIRRPGCGACREHAQQLSHLVQEYINGELSCMGIIKHINVDNDALLSFYYDYFHFPIYKDEKWAVFKDVMGDRKVSPWTLLKLAPRMTMRYKKKNITNIPLGGDIFTQGGVFIIDRNGNLRYTIYERYGEEFDMDELRREVNKALVSITAADPSCKIDTTIDPAEPHLSDQYEKTMNIEKDSQPYAPLETPNFVMSTVMEPKNENPSKGLANNGLENVQRPASRLQLLLAKKPLYYVKTTREESDRDKQQDAAGDDHSISDESLYTTPTTYDDINDDQWLFNV